MKVVTLVILACAITVGGCASVNDTNATATASNEPTYTPTGTMIPKKGQPKVDPQDMSPQATTKVDTQINLNSNSEMPTTVPFSMNQPTSYNKQIPVAVYDTLGNAHTMSMFYVKTGTNTWDVYTASDDLEVTSGKAAAALQTDPAALAARTAYETADNYLQKLKIMEMKWNADGWPSVDQADLNNYRSNQLLAK